MRLWLHLLALLLACALVDERAFAAEPVKIGALNEGWGPTPATVGLREGLKALGYREGEQFVIGVRFTQGDSKSLPTAVRELLQAGSDILFTSGTNPVKAAQAATATRRYNVLAPDKVRALRAFFLVDEQGLLRKQWLLGLAGDDIVFASEPIIKAVQELKGKR